MSKGISLEIHHLHGPGVRELASKMCEKNNNPYKTFPIAMEMYLLILMQV